MAPPEMFLQGPITLPRCYSPPSSSRQVTLCQWLRSLVLRVYSDNHMVPSMCYVVLASLHYIIVRQHGTGTRI
ncbi:hypothetical protein BDQ94DRAFT_132561 [Aspergillus welwitschiae]|uniref:Uncharacterized protein n=1 Tax=Aspergillus welwitschiae TaxID=1341132 RepID=A0A3F3QKH1_9EURO|nr:hypothetical protein BDQ94DRAFT_132561 [Aspergillus welwitschiae]RDH39176.1 hypothetical protein BDQ94DRAFT_132561 [Aspergillus welwitschiae]